MALGLGCRPDLGALRAWRKPLWGPRGSPSPCRPSAGAAARDPQVSAGDAAPQVPGGRALSCILGTLAQPHGESLTQEVA